MQKLQQPVEDAKANVGRTELLTDVFNNLNGRGRCCLQQGEHHIEHFLESVVFITGLQINLYLEQPMEMQLFATFFQLRK
jgi:hypothetical protein